MKSTRKIRLTSDVRPLTEEQIKGLSDHGLKAYRTKVLAFRDLAHDAANEYCCGQRAGCNVVVNTRPREELTEREVARIRKMDFLAAACNREWRKRDLGR
jgi:hypothetical protein